MITFFVLLSPRRRRGGRLALQAASPANFLFVFFPFGQERERERDEGRWRRGMGGRGRLEWPRENWSLLLVAVHQLQAIVSRPSSAVRWCGRLSVGKLARHRVPPSKDIIKSIKKKWTQIGVFFIFERIGKAKDSEVPQLGFLRTPCTPPGQSALWGRALQTVDGGCWERRRRGCGLQDPQGGGPGI